MFVVDDDSATLTCHDIDCNREVHIGCLEGVDEESIPEKWFCSEQCRQNILKFCCGKFIDGSRGRFIGCDAVEKCLHLEWYHLSCKNLR